MWLSAVVLSHSKNAIARAIVVLMALASSSAAQSFTTLYSFTGGSNAAFPSAGVIAGADGDLFGTTSAGGDRGYGTVYELSPGSGGAWSETLLYSFRGGSDGATPDAPLTLGAGNVLYGTTFAGGSSGDGTVFQLTPPAKPGDAWTETVLYSFKGGSDGSGPLTAVTLSTGGELYGTTFTGGTAAAGTIFQLTPPVGSANAWTESVIYSFLGGKDGQGPQSPLILHNGDLFGATCCGTEGGTVFRLAPSSGTWTKSILFSFNTRSSGDSPIGSLAIDKSVLYGVTALGGEYGYGILYSLTPQGAGKSYKLTTIHSFANGADGGSPDGGVVLASDGTLYVPMTSGCGYGAGCIVQYTPPPSGSGTWTEVVLYSFTGGSDGSQPQGLVLYSTNVLYGTTGFDGAAGSGTVFELIP